MILVDEALWVSHEVASETGIHGRCRAAVAGCTRYASFSTNPMNRQPAEPKASLYRATANVFRLRDVTSSELLLGRIDKPSRDPKDPESVFDVEGTAVACVPKILSNMLLDAVGQPLNQPWGFPERVLNSILRTLQATMFDLEKLNNLITMPLPLSYHQHCRIMLLIFATCIPLTVDPAAGLVDNVIMPFLIFWALMGFEILAELIENPLSDEETDIDIMQMIHSVEVHASHTFELTERHRAQARHALRRPFVDFGMAAGKELLAPEVKPESIHMRS